MCVFLNIIFDKHTEWELFPMSRQAFVSTYFVLRIKPDTTREYKEISLGSYPSEVNDLASEKENT